MSYRVFFQWFGLFLALVAVFVLQYSLVPFLPGSLRLLQLPIVVVVVLYLLQLPTLALYAAVGFGILLDIAFPQPFGVHLVSLLACAIVAFVLLQTVFTNRSLYSFMAITAIVSVLFMALFALLSWLASLFTGDALLYNWAFYARAGGITAIWHAVGIAALYYLVLFWHTRFV